MQFYATLYLEKNERRTFHWMTGTTKYRAHLRDFAQTLGIPCYGARDEGVFRIHSEESMRPSYMDNMYDQNKTGVVHGNLRGLLPFYDQMNKLFRSTLTPKVGDSSFIRGYTINLLKHARDETPIDVMDFLYNEIRLAMVDRRSLPLAPYIQAFVNRITGLDLPTNVIHPLYKPSIEKIIPGVTTRDLRNMATRDPTPPPPRESRSIMAALKSIFTICQSNSTKVAKLNRRTKKNTLRLKELQRAAGSLTVSPDGSELVPSDEEVFEDPFAPVDSSPIPSASGGDEIEEDEASS
jgi:hypothetical protein